MRLRNWVTHEVLPGVDFAFELNAHVYVVCITRGLEFAGPKTDERLKCFGRAVVLDIPSGRFWAEIYLGADDEREHDG